MKKHYETDGMKRSCEATVLSCEPDEKKALWRITLDESVFFPGGGGQNADQGEIVYGKSTVKVLGGSEQKDPSHPDEKIVSYQIDAPIPVGSRVLCKLDWELRFMRMQQHSGEHILSGLVHKTFGYENVSFHLSDTEPITVCFSGPLSREEVLGLEEKYLIVEPDEKRGKTLLREILEGGNFGRSGKLDQHSTSKKYFQKTWRNMRLAKEYPAEALCEPFFRTWHFLWRLAHK